MSNKVRPTDISNRFNIPVQTATNWSKAKGSWRYTLYIELSKVYAEGVVSENIKLSDEEKKIEWGVKK